MGTGASAKPKVLSDEELHSSALDLVGYVYLFLITFIFYFLSWQILAVLRYNCST